MTKHTNKDQNGKGARPQVPVDNPMETGWYRTVPLAAVILGFATVALLWSDLPAEVPTRFDLDGQPSSYAPRWVLWFLPLLNLTLFYVLEKAPSPAWQQYNIPLVKETEENRERQQYLNYQLVAQVRLVVCLLLAYIAYSTTQISAGLAGEMNMFVFGGLLGLMFVIIGVQAYRMVRAK